MSSLDRPSSGDPPASDDRLPAPSEMIAHLDRFAFGQSEAKEALANCFYSHYLGVAYRHLHPEQSDPFGRNHMLLLGPTGCGKSYLVRKLAEHLELPFVFGSAAGLVEAGYVGEGQVDSLVRALLVRADFDIRAAQHGMIFLDEIDKIRRQTTGTRDVSGEGVQNALLTLMDGRIVTVRVNGDCYEVDTSQILFVCAGAFVRLARQMRRRLQPAPGAPGAHDPSDDELLARVSAEDLERYGMIPELVGRFSAIRAVRSLGAEDHRRVLFETEESPLLQQRRFFEMHGVELVVTDGAIEAIVEQSTGMGTGVRGLRALVQSVLAAPRGRLPELHAAGIGRVTLTEGAVRGWEDSVLEPLPSRPTRRPPADALRRSARQLSRPSANARLQALARRIDRPLAGDRPRSEGRESTPPRDQVRRQMDRLKVTLGWRRARRAARLLWWSLEERHSDRPEQMLLLADWLVSHEVTIDEFFVASLWAESDDISAIRHSVEQLRRRNDGRIVEPTPTRSDAPRRKPSRAAARPPARPEPPPPRERPADWLFGPEEDR